MASKANGVLVMQGGPNSGMSIPLSGRVLTVGRRQDNDIVIDEPPVSRRHAIIMETPQGFIVRDLNSTNGTFVNRSRLGVGDHSLRHGDQIALAGSSVTLVFKEEGSRTLRLEVSDAPVPNGAFLALDGGSREVTLRGKRLEPPLTPREFELLRFLESRLAAVVSRDELLRNVWPEAPATEAAAVLVDGAIESLRARIEEEPRQPRYLITVGEFGYVFNHP